MVISVAPKMTKSGAFLPFFIRFALAARSAIEKHSSTTKRGSLCWACTLYRPVLLECDEVDAGVTLPLLGSAASATEANRKRNKIVRPHLENGQTEIDTVWWLAPSQCVDYDEFNELVTCPLQEILQGLQNTVRQGHKSDSSTIRPRWNASSLPTWIYKSIYNLYDMIFWLHRTLRRPWPFRFC